MIESGIKFKRKRDTKQVGRSPSRIVLECGSLPSDPQFRPWGRCGLARKAVKPKKEKRKWDKQWLVLKRK